VTRRSRPPYRVNLAPAAVRQLRKLPPGDAGRLREPILQLGLDPRPRGATGIADTDFLRIRVGEWRVIYLVDDEAREVVVLRIARRSESTYRRVT
jgi:mRNA interferase RelE/StbE